MKNFEIERKFLVRDESWRTCVREATRIRQAYLRSDGEGSIRVRLRDRRPSTLTIKSKAAQVQRLELEYEIPDSDAELLFGLCQGAIVEKTRHLVSWEGVTWEVDVFTGANTGLVMAEIELQSVDQAVAFPPWLGREVSGDAAYYNSALSRRPYATWSSTG